MTTVDAPVGLWQNRNWRRLWTAQAVSLIGDFVFNTTVVLWVATVIVGDRPWSAAAVAGVLIAAGLPVLLVAPVAGVYVDRWDRRRTMMAADLIRAALISVLLIVPLFGTGWPVGVQLSLLYGIVFLTSATSQFFSPARFAIIASTVPKEDRPKAFGISTATGSTASVIGPPLAAPLLFGTGVQWALVVDVVSFLVSFLCARALLIPAREVPASNAGRKAAFWPEFKEGLGFFFHNRVLVILVAAVCVYTFGVGAINVLDVFFVKENLHVSPSWLGTLGAAFGLGSVLGALSAGWIVKRISDVKVFAFGMAATGLIVIAYARTTWLPIAIALLVIAGLPLSAVNVVVGPLVLKTTPNHLVGRISTVMNPLVFVASLLSMAVTGFMASTVLNGMHVVVGGITFGRVDTIFTASAVFMILAGLGAAKPLARKTSEPVEAPKMEATATPVEATS